MRHYIILFIALFSVHLAFGQVSSIRIGNNAILAIKGNKLYKSIDGGTSYPEELSLSSQGTGLSLDNDGYGFLVGMSGLAYKIVPAGNASFTYTLIPTDADLTDDKGSGIAAVDLKSVKFTDRTSGYITQVNGVVLKTVDGGFHWKVQETGGGSTPLLALGTAENGTLVDGSGTVHQLRDRSMTFGSRFWYDELGRLVLSQNAKQFYIENYPSSTSFASVSGTGTVRAYSYTMYDDIGRITEVGELLSRAEVPTHKHETQIKYSVHAGFVSNGVQREITKTYYDKVKYANIQANFTQENLRPRVASVTYQNIAGNTYDRATHYNYDVHGNVKNLIQEINTSTGSVQVSIKKRMDYEYDLVSGKVNYFYYQKNQNDQLIHKYEYDGDNRIVNVFTSRDGILWDRDVKYDYYAHGPLAKTTLGEKSIEENNYTYTVQGWIKGVNGNTFSYSLGYFDDGALLKDYEAINGVNSNLPTPINGGRSLFNGNIATMNSETPNQFGGSRFTQQFEYDQLNRLMASTNVGAVNPNSFKTSYEYDAGGNITNLKRFDATGVQYDNMQYTLHNTANGYDKNTNKLRTVDDDGAYTSLNTTDIDDQNVDNYQYDDIGNLIKDTQEEIANIEWTVYGKVRKITRTAGSIKPDLEFAYDASGNRVAKTVIPHDNTGAVISSAITTTFYLRDPQGNVLSIYEKAGTSPLTLSEQYVYGSSRLATLKPTYASDDSMHVTGQKEYEITDHLGNVRLTLNDKGTVTSAIDYLPFGMMARSWNPTESRYSFNGKENDEEVQGWQDYGMREYDKRICRFISVDPLTKEYPWYTPYQFAGNKPIWATDLDGAEEKPTNNGATKDKSEDKSEDDSKEKISTKKIDPAQIKIGFFKIDRTQKLGGPKTNLRTDFQWATGKGFVKGINSGSAKGFQDEFRLDELSSFLHLDFTLPDNNTNLDVSFSAFRNHLKGGLQLDDGNFIEFGSGNSQVGGGVGLDAATNPFKGWTASASLFVGVGPQRSIFKSGTNLVSTRSKLVGMGEVGIFGIHITTPTVFKIFSITGSINATLHHVSFADFSITNSTSGTKTEYSGVRFTNVGISPTIQFNFSLGAR